MSSLVNYLGKLIKRAITQTAPMRGKTGAGVKSYTVFKKKRSAFYPFHTPNKNLKRANTKQKCHEKARTNNQRHQSDYFPVFWQHHSLGGVCWQRTYHFLMDVLNFVSERANMDLRLLFQVNFNDFWFELVGAWRQSRFKLHKVLSLGQVTYLEEVWKRQRQNRFDLRWVVNRPDFHREMWLQFMKASSFHIPTHNSHLWLFKYHKIQAFDILRSNLQKRKMKYFSKHVFSL